MDLKSWQRIVNCTCCGKEFITTKYKIESNNNGNIFCSHECYSKYRSKYYIKDKASVYRKQKVYCSNCKKEILVPPNKLKCKNKDGVNHIFCSKECYYNFRKTYYVGDKLYNNGKKMDKSFCEKVRRNTLKRYANGVLDRQTQPQRFINSILDELNIPYINEKTIGYYSVDNYLTKNGLIIEVMGDYFHANPNKYLEQELNNMQRKDITRDMRKHTYIKKYYNIDILYIWENEIKNNIDLCKTLILEYINNNGQLNDYNSFNFFICKEKLTLKKEIINPYFIKNP